MNMELSQKEDKLELSQKEDKIKLYENWNEVVLDRRKIFMPLCDILSFLKNRGDNHLRYYNFTRHFWMFGKDSASPSDVYCLNFKHKIDNLKDGYNPTKPMTFHTDSLAARDWCFVIYDKNTKKCWPISIEQAHKRAYRLKNKTPNSIDYIIEN